MAKGQAIPADSLKSIETDRPDQTEASSLVPKGFVQIEAGWLRQVNKQEGITTVSQLVPTILVRYGLLPSLELRLLVEHLSIKGKDSHAGSINGMGPVAVGTKIKIAEEQGLLPEMAFIGHLTLRTGKPEFRPAYVVPDFRFSLSHTLSEKLSLGYNVGYEWAPDKAAGQAIYTLSLAREVTDRLGAFIEVFGQKPKQENWQHQLDGGFTFQILPNLQLDTSVGLGLSSSAPDFFVGGGVSVRLPK
ncbi:transporter [Nibribacter ruber]|uniref:Transporter n=1 Tax=Nibribacter ruber TaxID=2698458 RepID=A0A6P1NWC5_9BACT|nr:transporter [Nibribacter ruber]QHL86085.1 transporter [Nibribacter ruber]